VAVPIPRVVVAQEVGKLTQHRQSVIISRVVQITASNYFDCPHWFSTTNETGGDVVSQTKVLVQNFFTAARFTAHFSGSTF
jgi:hypothetical protein